ncbi:CNH domain-containing protein [Trypanosoma rangeli]|uniref:CNH domain-containing protein n=1 Tax=Trypanosoma rangeli TaxID=5698 RepID=A0A3R7M5A4_TRYRA|nr:CNH domain-containing protein [Trypanosoma rangeli]RNF09300.1 CNH domain-containing protein [Trypanosoma rangeli]|eukprot:RNF09300.1 CNH domain-containing protein [Trypanosoma rangeli]
MSHEAFRLTELKKKLPYKIESIATVRNLFFVGTNDGKLIVYEVSLQDHDAQCVYIHSSKHKQPIRMIIPIAEEEILLLVVGDVISVHQLNHMTSAQLDCLPEDRLPELHTVKGTKDVVALHLKRQRGTFYMAVLQRKKITVYAYRQQLKEFVIVNDGLLLPDGAKAVLWVGKNLMIGFRREYVLMQVANGVTDCLYPTGKSGTPLLLSLDPVPEVLVGEETTGVRALHDGSRVPGKNGMPWSSIPTSAAYIHPFLLTIHSGGNCIEVRLPFFTDNVKAADAELWQSISLKCADRISQRPFADFDANLPKETTPPDTLRKDITIVVNSSNTVYLLELVPIREQVLALASVDCVEAGLLLCQLCTNEVDQVTVGSLKTQFALWSFNTKKDFKTAMLRFRDANVDPLLVIYLFPGFLTQRAQAEWQPPQAHTHPLETTELAQHMPNALAAFLDYAVPLRREYATVETEMLAEAIDTAILKAYVILGDEPQLLSFLAEGNACSLAESEVFLAESEQWVALVMLWYSHRQHHKSLALLQALGTTGERISLKSLLSTSSSWVGLSFDAAFSRILQPLLVKALGDSGSMLVAPSEGGKTDFIPQTVMAQLLAEVAVDVEPSQQTYLLRRCVGVVVTILYMRLLSWEERESMALVEQYSPWILANVSPRWSVRMFAGVGLQPKDYAAVLRIIGSDMSDIGATQPYERVVEWLSFIFADTCNVSTDASLHDAYFQSLMQLVLSPSCATAATAEEEQWTATGRQRLEKFLRSSHHIDLTRVQAVLEQPEVRGLMYAERAIIYYRLKRHEEAIRMFLYEAQQLQAAQDYATRVGRDGQDGFQILLHLLLSPGDGCTGPRLSDALTIVNTCDEVNPFTALPMLPADTPLAPIAGFVKRSLRDASARSRNAAIRASVLEARIRQAELKLARERALQVVLDLGSSCVVCGKKLRPDVVFARFPNDVVVHQACMEDEHICPVTYKDFRLGIEPVARGTL